MGQMNSFYVKFTNSRDLRWGSSTICSVRPIVLCNRHLRCGSATRIVSGLITWHAIRLLRTVRVKDDAIRFVRCSTRRDSVDVSSTLRAQP
jgi:hypothetical protein